jgi:hypothetical protein
MRNLSAVDTKHYTTINVLCAKAAILTILKYEDALRNAPTFIALTDTFAQDPSKTSCEREVAYNLSQLPVTQSRPWAYISNPVSNFIDNDGDDDDNNNDRCYSSSAERTLCECLLYLQHAKGPIWQCARLAELRPVQQTVQWYQKQASKAARCSCTARADLTLKHLAVDSYWSLSRR